MAVPACLPACPTTLSPACVSECLPAFLLPGSQLRSSHPASASTSTPPHHVGPPPGNKLLLVAVQGVKTNVLFLENVLRHPEFLAGDCVVLCAF